MNIEKLPLNTKSPPVRRAFNLLNLEARVGIEPTHKGFADLSLTTWVPRLGWAYFCPAEL